MNKSAHAKKYKEYLLSNEWIKIRADLITIYGGCELCDSTRSLQVHHLTYKNLFFEEPEDLILLCARCHMVEHGLYKPKKSYKNHNKSKAKTLLYYRKKFRVKTGKNVKGGRGWRGLAVLVAIAYGRHWGGGSKRRAKTFVKNVIQ